MMSEIVMAMTLIIRLFCIHVRKSVLSKRKV
jgi:hypothetical protein